MFKFQGDLCTLWNTVNQSVQFSSSPLLVWFAAIASQSFIHFSASSFSVVSPWNTIHCPRGSPESSGIDQLSSVRGPVGPQPVVSASTRSHSSPPLHPDCMCMNIDVNYSSSQRRCSVFDFPEYIFFSPITYWLTLTNSSTHQCCKSGRSWRWPFVALHSRNLKLALWFCRAASFYPLGFFHQKDIFQYNRSSMPARGVAKKNQKQNKNASLTANYRGWITAD